VESTEVRSSALLTWRGHVLVRWLFEGYRRFELEPVAARRVLVTHVEDVHGLLAPLFALALGARVQASHDALNAALKARAEASSETRRADASAGRACERTRRCS
jgi:hypothetical protein